MKKSVGIVFILSLVGLVSGLIGGIFFFLFIRLSISSLGMENLPIGGLVLLSFLVIPIVLAIVYFILGLISFWIFNLFLRIIKGLDMYFEELVS